MKLQDHVRFTRLWVGGSFEHSQVYVQPGEEATVIYIHPSQRFANVCLKDSNVTLVDVLTAALEVIPASKFEVGQYVHVLDGKEVGRITAPYTSPLGPSWVVEFISDGKKLNCHQDSLTLAEPQQFSLCATVLYCGSAPAIIIGFTWEGVRTYDIMLKDGHTLRNVDRRWLTLEPLPESKFKPGDLVELLVDQPIYINLEGTITHMVTKGTLLLVHLGQSGGDDDLVAVQDADLTGPVFYVNASKLRLVKAAPKFQVGAHVRLKYVYVCDIGLKLLPGRLGKVVATQNDNLVDVRFDNKITVHNMPIDKLELAPC